MEIGHEPIFKKGEGDSKMISGFAYPCHGPMCQTPELAAANPGVAMNTGPDADTMYEHSAFPVGHSL